jgi:hypothetical protein
MGIDWEVFVRLGYFVYFLARKFNSKDVQNSLVCSKKVTFVSCVAHTEPIKMQILGSLVEFLFLYFLVNEK